MKRLSFNWTQSQERLLKSTAEKHGMRDLASGNRFNLFTELLWLVDGLPLKKRSPCVTGD